MPTIREIAKLARVSKSTVSLVLSGKNNVAPETRKRVLETLAHLERSKSVVNPIPAETDVKLARTNLSVVLLHPWWLSSTEFFKDILHGIQTAADEQGVSLRLADVHSSRMQDITQHIYFVDPELRPAGVIMLNAKEAELFIYEFEAKGIVCALVGTTPPNPAIRTVASDEVEAGYFAAKHLIDQGHQRIMFITDRLDDQYQRDRLQGYKNALVEVDIPFEDRHVLITGYHNELPVSLWTGGNDCTAVITANEATLKLMLPLFKALQIRIPADLSLVSFDDCSLARYNTPPITTIAYPLYEQGYWGMNLLVNQIREPKIKHFQMTFGVKLIVRESCRTL